MLIGGEGDDALYGGGGTDILDGGRGNDELYRDEFDIVKWRPGDGIDAVYGVSGQVLLENISTDGISIQQDTAVDGSQILGVTYGQETLWISRGFLDTGTTYDFMDGALDQAALMRLAPSVNIYGTQAGDTIYGSDQNDVLTGYMGTASDADADDQLFGQGGADHIEGGLGNDRLDGGTGSDVLVGGLGDDVYVVDDIGDLAIENAGEGADTVETTIDYAAPGDIDNVALLGTATIDAAGNAANNRLFGNTAANTLDGLDGDDVLLGRAGNDVLDGGAGADQLYGEDGNDRLDGGMQNDTLYGGAGDDVFVAALGSGTDVVVDVEGVNVIEFSAGIARESLDITQYQGDDGAYYLRIGYGAGGDVIAVKNGLSGIIQNYRFADGTSVSHADLIGQATVPILIEGTRRNDVIHGSNLVDRIQGGAGNDQLFGAAGADMLLGGSGADTLNGGADGDTLDGGLGNDTLLGGVGADRYVLQWGMGFDLIIDDGAELSTLEMGPGVQLADLEIVRDLDDLVVRFIGSEQGVRIQSYGAASQNWRLQDETGTLRVLNDLITEPSSTGTPPNFDAVSASFTRRVRSNFINTLTGSDAETGYTMDADGVLRKTASSVSSNFIDTAYSSARIQTENVTADSASFMQTTPAFDTQYSYASSVTYKTNYTAPLGSYGGISGGYGSGSRRYRSLEDGNAGYEVPVGGGVVMVYGQSQDQDGGQSVSAESYNDDVGSTQPIGMWVFDNGSGTGIGTSVTHSVSHRDATLTLENVMGGAGNNDITVIGNAIVDAGGGDDLIVAGAQRWDSSYGNSFVPDRYSYVGSFDSRDTGALLYGNDGADSLVGGESNDLLIGGNDADYVDGRLGEDTYVVRRGEVGYDVIADSGMFVRILSEWPVSRYSEWYYRSIGMPDYMTRLSNGEVIPQLPVLSPNDFAAMQQLIQADVIETDTVEFSAGITLDQLTFAWGEVQLNSPVTLTTNSLFSQPWMGGVGTSFRTLDISWAAGEGVRIVIPHTYIPGLAGPVDPRGGRAGAPLDPHARSDEYLGLGIEQFRFADGTTLSMADMVALAPPALSFDPHIQAPDTNLVGTTGDDVLVGGNGNDTLDGLNGADQMYGDTGDDVYYVDNSADAVSETLNAGLDTVNSVVSYSLSENVEQLTLTGADAIDGTGNTLANVVTGNDAGNVLNGGEGGDTLQGMAGDDMLNGGAGDDMLQTGYGNDYAYGGAGNDTLIGGGTPAGVWTTDMLYGEDGDDLIQAGSKNYTQAYGGAGNDDLRGGSGVTNLYGQDGNDTLTAGTGYTTLYGGAGADRMVGNALGNTYSVDNAGDVIVDVPGGGIDTVNSSISYALGGELENLTLIGSAAIAGTGNAGNNTLDGSQNTAANVLTGGIGDDVYRLGAGDSVVENANEGMDTVYAAFSYTLGNNVENLVLTSATNATATGNTLNNRLTGSNANDVLNGNAGNDYLNGMYGNDTLNGGTGADEMVGGYGNDIYYVNEVGDVVTELSGQGTDTVNSAISYTLGANVERLTLTGTTAGVATGNTLANILTGNGVANTLIGDAGNDTVRGMGGNDWLLAGTGNDVLEGGDGDDILSGATGADTLTGGWGSDQYIFARDQGQDLIRDYDSRDADTATYGQTVDAVQFNGEIAHDQLWFSRNGDNLYVDVIGTGDRDRIIVENWYLAEAYQVEELWSSDGYLLLNDQVEQLVQAMAAFAPPAAGQLTLPDSYRADLDPVLAANWQAA